MHFNLASLLLPNNYLRKPLYFGTPGLKFNIVGSGISLIPFERGVMRYTSISNFHLSNAYMAKVDGHRGLKKVGHFQTKFSKNNQKEDNIH